MKYIVTFTYLDGEKFELEVHPDDMNTFCEAISSGNVYFNGKRGCGVWIPIDKIRHFGVESVDEDGKRVVVKSQDIEAKDD